MKKLILTVILLAVPLYSSSDELLLGGFSVHTVSNDITNSFHRAFIYVHDEDWLGGYVRNSYDQDSFVVAYRIYHNSIKSGLIETDIFLGAVKGYDKCFGRYSKEDRAEGKSKVIACPLPVINAAINTDTWVKPVISLWGDALVLTGKIDF